MEALRGPSLEGANPGVIDGVRNLDEAEGDEDGAAGVVVSLIVAVVSLFIAVGTAMGAAVEKRDPVLEVNRVDLGLGMRDGELREELVLVGGVLGAAAGRSFGTEGRGTGADEGDSERGVKSDSGGKIGVCPWGARA